MRRTLFIILLASLGLCALDVGADPVHVVFTGVNGRNDGQYYVSPYYGTIDGQPVTLDCIDFLNEVNFGQKWDANLSTITDGSTLDQTRYGGPARNTALFPTAGDALIAYQEAAWLTEQFPKTPDGNNVDIQYAMWDLFIPGIRVSAAGRFGTGTHGSQYWLDQAAANYQGGDYSGFRVVTNLAPVELQAPGQVQEFLTDPPVSAPEPASLILLGSGLLAAGWKLRRRTAHREM
jgi:hypothetical protein